MTDVTLYSLYTHRMHLIKNSSGFVNMGRREGDRKTEKHPERGQQIEQVTPHFSCFIVKKRNGKEKNEMNVGTSFTNQGRGEVGKA